MECILAVDMDSLLRTIQHSLLYLHTRTIPQQHFILVYGLIFDICLLDIYQSEVCLLTTKHRYRMHSIALHSSPRFASSSSIIKDIKKMGFSNRITDKSTQLHGMNVVGLLIQWTQITLLELTDGNGKVEKQNTCILVSSRSRYFRALLDTLLSLL